MQGVEEVHHVLGRRGVEVASRFVGEHDRRLRDDRARNGYALPLSSGELCGAVFRPVCEADPCQGGQRKRPSLRVGCAPIDEGLHDVAERGQPGDELEALEHEPDLVVADAREAPVARHADASSVQGVVPGGWRVEAANEMEQRRLARTGGPDDGDGVALGDAKRDVVEGRDGAGAHSVALADAGQGDERHQAEGSPAGPSGRSVGDVSA